MAEDDEDALLRRWLDLRDEQAFVALAGRYQPMIAATALRLLDGDGAAADEAVQAVLVVLSERARTLHSAAVLGSWLHRTTQLVIRNMRRARQSRRRHERPLSDLDALAAPEPAAELPAAELDAALDRIRPRQREAIIRHFLLGRSREEVARELGCSLEALHKRLQLGLRQLRVVLARRGVALGLPALSAELGSLATGGSNAPASLPLTSQAAQALAERTLAAIRWAAWKTATAVVATALGVLAVVPALLAGEVDHGEPAADPVAAVEAHVVPASATPPVRILGRAPFQSEREISRISLSPDGRLLAAGSSWRTAEIVVWDTGTGSATAHLTPEHLDAEWLHRMEWSRDGRRLFLLLADDAGNKIEIWDPFGAVRQRTHRSRGRFLVVDEANDLLATLEGGGRAQDRNAADDARLVLRSLSTGDVRLELDGVVTRHGHRWSYVIDEACLSPDGRRFLATYDIVATGSDRPRREEWHTHCVVWNLETKQVESEWSLPDGMLGRDQPQWLDADRVLLPELWRVDGRGSAAEALMLDVHTGGILQTFPGVGRLHPDATAVLALRENEIVSCPLDDGPARTVVSAEGISPRGGLVTGGPLIASAAGMHMPFIYHLEEGRIISPHRQAHRALAYCSYASDGRLLVGDGLYIKTYDPTGTRCDEIRAYSSYGHTAVDSSGRRLVTLGEPIRDVWHELIIRDAIGGAVVRQVGSASSSTETVIDFLDDDRVICYGGDGKAMKVIDVRGGHELLKERGDWTWRISWHAIWGDALLVAHWTWDEMDWYIGRFDLDGGFSAFLLPDGRPVPATRRAALDEVHDAVYLVHDGPAPNAGLWDAATGRRLRELPAMPELYDTGLDHVDPVRSQLFRAHAATQDERFDWRGERILTPHAWIDLREERPEIVRFPDAPFVSLDEGATLRAELVDDALVLRDTRSGIEVWRYPLPAGEMPGRKPVSLLWRPGGGQLTITFADTPALLQVDLFSSDGARAAADAVDAAAALAACAPLALLQGRQTETRLLDLALGEDQALARRALHILEWRIRIGSSEAAALERLAPLGAAAEDCRHRLRCEERRAELARRLREAPPPAEPVAPEPAAIDF